MTRQYEARWRRCQLMWLMMIWTIWCLALTGSSEAWGQVRVASDGNVVMTSADLRGLLLAAETARAEADALREVVSAERSTAKGCSLRAEVLSAAIEAERASWRQLEDALNADLRTARREKVSWVITGLAFGVIAGALLQ